MEIRINNKDIHRYKYVRRKVRIKKKDSKEEDKVSFGEIFLNIKELKDQGLYLYQVLKRAYLKQHKNIK